MTNIITYQTEPAALNPIAPRSKHTRNDVTGESRSLEDFYPSAWHEHVPSIRKRPRIMSRDKLDLPANDSSAPFERRTQQRDMFEDKVMGLILKNLEDTRALRREVASLFERTRHY